MDLWDYKHAKEAPADDAIERTRALIGCNSLELDVKQQTAGLKKRGQSLDTGGIGKGFAGDRFMAIFREYGLESAVSNIGGNVCTLGNKPDGSPWRVGIRHPRRRGLLGAAAVTGMAVVTSGDYERYFTDAEGRRCHHILDPLTGRPAESGLIGVTVIADSAMTADALSTALFIGGLDRGLELIKKYPRAEALFVDAGLRVYVTKGLEGRFEAAAGIKEVYGS